MIDYLKNIEHAVTKVFEAINYETHELMSLAQERQNILTEPEYLKKLCMDCDLQEDYDEMKIINIFQRASEAQKKLPLKLKEVDTKFAEVAADIALHETSERILCGVILQFAKQGISLIHKDLSACPPGRKVGSQDLKTVIWQTRNHAIHYEESPNHMKSVIECFRKLEEDFGVQFSLNSHPGVNLSKEVIQVLKWYGHETFREDMLLLSQ